MLRAPIGNPASKGILPSEHPGFSSQMGTQTVKMQFGVPAQKMQNPQHHFPQHIGNVAADFRFSLISSGHLSSLTSFLLTDLGKTAPVVFDNLTLRLGSESTHPEVLLPSYK